MAVSAHGTLLKMGDGALPTEAFTTIAEVGDISGPGLSRDMLEVTSHDSIYKAPVPGMISLSDVTFTINYTGATTQKALDTAAAKTTPTNFQLVSPLPTPETITFPAYVKEIGRESPVEGILTRQITLTVAGIWTTTP